MLRITAIVASFGLTGLLAFTGTAIAGEKFGHYPHMHSALSELRATHIELKDAAHDFGGHRVKALEAVDAAIDQIDKALRAVGDTVKGAGKVNPDVYKKYPGYPHIHHGLAELREARTELQTAKHDFAGHRAKALQAVNYAIEQLELALKFAKK
jgi:hypothetical protein